MSHESQAAVAGRGAGVDPIAIDLRVGGEGSGGFRALQERVAGALSVPMFFVVGSQRSGTTWVQKLLDAHPLLVCKGEARYFWVLKALAMLRDRYNGYQTVGEEGKLGDAELVHLFQTMVGLVQSSWVGERRPLWVGEKTPEHCQFLPMLTYSFPGSRVVHIIRDGRDCAVSGWLHANNRNNPKFHAEYPTFAAYAAFAAKNWATNVHAAVEFGKRCPGRYLELRYERLHEDARGELVRVLRFLDLVPEGEDVERCVAAASFRELAAGRERGEEDADSHYRKGVVGDWREHFDGETRAIFNAIAGELMGRLGYGG